MLERLGIMYLSSILKRDGHRVNLLITEGLSDSDIIANVKAYGAGIIGYSVMTGEHHYAISLNKMLKDHAKFLAVFGGPHPTFMPEMIENDGVDAICRGEGEIVFPELARRMAQGKDFYDINNFWFKRGGVVVKNPLGALIEDLDILPFPDRQLMYDANPAIALIGYKAFTAMRGYPYSCTYCFNHSYNELAKGKGSVLRYRSVSNVLNEIKQVRNAYFLDRVHMYDDTFLLKPAGWLEEFSVRYPKEIGLPFSCNVRANLMTDEAGQLLKKTGCVWVAIGVECGNEQIANTLLKRNIRNEQLISACRIIRKYKIKLFTQNLVGLPVDDPLAVDLETLDFNITLRPNYVWSSILYPYPLTEIGRFAISKGLYRPDFDKALVSNKTETCLDFKDSAVKRKIANLHKLFSIIVCFPFLRPLTGFLISFPLTNFYTWLYFGFYGYHFVWKNASWKERRRTLKHYIKFYFRYVPNVERKKVFADSKAKISYPISS